MAVPELADIGKRCLVNFNNPLQRNSVFKLVEKTENNTWLIQKEKPFYPNVNYSDINNNTVDGREPFEVANEWFNQVEVTILNG